MPTIDQFRALIPNGDTLSDYDVVKEVSRTLEMDPRYIADRLGFEANKPGFVSDIKRGAGQVIEALGSTAQDLGLPNVGKSVESYGAGITFKNPSQINTVEEALRSPWTTTREAVGEVVPQVATSVGTGLAGRVIGGALGLPFGPAGVAIGQTLGAGAGAYLGNLAQEYGGIRAEQREQGIDDRGRALATGGAAAVLDTALGAERIANKFLAKGSDILAREAGTSLGKQVAKQTAIGTGIEAGTEGVQTALERIGAYKDVTSAEGLNEIGLSMIKGGIGGGVIRGGLSAVAGERQPEGGSLLGGTSQQTGSDIQQSFTQPDISATPTTTEAPAATATANVAPVVSGGSTDIAQAQQQATAENQAAAQAQKQQVARENAFSSIGATYNPEGQGSLSIFGQTVLGPQIGTFGNALASKVAALPPQAVQIANAISQANAAFATPEKPSPLVSFTYNGNNPIGSADKVLKALEKVTEKFQIGHVASVDEAASNLNTLSKNAKGAYLEQLNAIHEALTGKDTDGFIASQESKAAKEGAKNGKLQLQTATGVGTVPVEGGTGEANGTNAGAVQPGGVQPVGAGGVAEGSLGLQVGQPSGEGIRNGTGAVSGVVGGAPVGTGQGQVNEQAQATQSGVGGGQVSGQSEQANQSGVDQKLVQNGPRQYEPRIRYYATDLSHIPGVRRVEIILDLLTTALAPKVQRSNVVSAATRAEILRLALLEQLPHKSIAEYTNLNVDTVEKQLERMGVALEDGEFQITDTELAQSLVAVADTYRSPEFPDGIGLEEMTALYSTRYEGEETSMQTLSEEMQTEGVKGDRSAKLLADEMYGGESGEGKSMGEVGSAGGSQGAVDTTGAAQLNAIAAKVAPLQTLLDSLPPKDPRRAAVQKEIDAVWEPYRKEQHKRASEGEVAVDEGEENAVQESSTEEVPVREGAGGGEAVGKGNAKKRKAAGTRKAKAEPKQESKPEEVKPPEVQTPAEQWNALTVLAPELPAYEVLSRDEKTRWDDLAKRGTANLAAAVRIIGDVAGATGTALAKQTPAAEGTRGNAPALTDESNVIDVEARVINETIAPKVAALPAPQIDRLEKFYGLKRDTEEFLARVKEDVVTFATKGAEAVSAAIRDVIKTISEGVLAMALVFNPNISASNFAFNLPQTYEQTITVQADVPAEAVAKMSPTAQMVYRNMAPVAKKSGKGFIIADKPAGQVHFFNADGSVLVQDTALFGKETGDKLAKSSLLGGPKVTPAGRFTLQVADTEDYAGGKVLRLVESQDATDSTFIAVHAAWLGDPTEKRAERLKSSNPADRKISYGCINTSHDTFLKQVLPNIEGFNGGMIFVLPDAVENTADLFAAQKQTITGTQKTAAATNEVNRAQVGKEEKQLFGKDSAVVNPYTAAELVKEISDFVRSAINTRRLKVVDSVQDLLESADPVEQELGASIALNKAYGVAANGKAYLVANRITKGQGRAKFLHEVGAHIGMEGLLTDEQLDNLTDQIFEWAKRDDGSRESQLAVRAILRADAAGTPDEDLRSEVLAYFVEEAMQSGIEPSAALKLGGPLGQWFRALYAAFKSAIRRLGMNPEKLNAKDVVNMAYGAARLEMAGTYHGTAADFRRFNHMFMGSGEGAQAFGWGTYLAQRFGIAKGYWQADVRRKTKKENLVTYDGKPIAEVLLGISTRVKAGTATDEDVAIRTTYTAIVNAMLSGWSKTDDILYQAHKTIAEAAQSDNKATKAKAQNALTWLEGKNSRGKLNIGLFGTQEVSVAPEGNVLRVDVGVNENELLGWDTPLSAQPDVLAKLKARLPESVQDDLLDETNLDLDEMTGEDLYRGLQSLETKTGLLSEQFDVADYNERLADAGAKQIVSTYLDEKVGLPGLKFLDSESRGNDRTLKAKLKQKQDLLSEKEEALAKASAEATRWEGLYDTAPADQKEYARKTWLNSVSARTSREFEVEQLKQDIARDQQKLRALENRTYNLVIFNDKNIFRVGSREGNRRENMKFGVDVGIQRLPKPLQSAAGRITTDLLYQAKKGVLASAITEDVVNMASKYMRSAADYLKAQYARQALRLRHELNVEKVLQQYDKLPKELQGTGKGSVNEFIFDSTTTGLWGYYPGEEFVGTSLLNIDKGMEARFNAFPPAAQKLIKDVFAYGNEALRDKQKAVKDAIDREFADREKAAIGDADAMDKIAKDKAKLMKRESRLNNLVNSKPYAYLGRYGDFVMVAKSKEYKHYEELAEQRDPAAISWIEQNETDPKHYVVEFAETLSEAKAVAERLGATGMYDMPEAFEKEAYADYLSSSDSYVAINRLRKMVAQEFKGGDPDALKSIDKMLGDLYLITAAESSARKSMLQRKDITGADKDMMRNMATSGRANAHFLATLQYNDEIADSINKMRQERKYNNEAATPFFNELLKRHASSMKYETPSTLSSFLTKTTSVWFLATSPAFYLQQMLQTYVLSLPYIAGRLGYFRSARAINAAYKDMSGLVKGISLTDHVDFDKAPADVRGMLQTLVGMGKIDIGVDADAKARAGERNIANRALHKLQSVNTRIESINRATAAIAAYRGYLQRYGKDKTDAATKFAAEVVSNTHGSYDGFNTPRIMQSNAGRVAFQFKRFQIIQLSMLAKLISTAFGKSSKEEKAVARKMLGFITAQMAAIGGVLAVPFVSQAAWILSKVASALGDDEPEDPEVMLRRWIGDQAVADLILRGATGAAGIESLGKKLGMENVASPFGPYAQIDMTSRAGAEKALVAMMGASAGLSLKMADAFGFMLKGDYYRGLEMAMPNGIGNAMKGYRMLDEGVTRRNKDVVLKPEEISVVDAAFQAVGLPTTTITRQQFTQRVVAQQNQYYSDKASEIKTNYVSASKDGDTGAMAEARQEWEELQASRRAKGYKVQPMSELFQAVAEARKRERGVVGGVETTKSNKRFVEAVSRL